jgi:hypothetical protein
MDTAKLRSLRGGEIKLRRHCHKITCCSRNKADFSISVFVAMVTVKS